MFKSKGRKMKNNNLIIIILLLFSLKARSQNIDSLLNLSDTLKNKCELRIYKDKGITNSGFVFILYKNKNDEWKSEYIQWFEPTLNNEKFRFYKKELKYNKNYLELWLTIQTKNIEFLPNESYFQYKKEKKIIEKERNQYTMSIRKLNIIDGYSYKLKYKNGDIKNEIEYNNPESYLKSNPEIDELFDFVEILRILRSEFNIEL
jgi:hypothetical protein